ncbi:MAG: DNA repair protein RadC [Candidatus Edwardsbacteria bacterium]|nr:DNA repair protein RadC [Candidatus Edwardsbacteria bacterium]MBU1577457.1 DNA repair protein RadC [Candidatus Edwardsbacteria bacterium]MBU2464180.1 DNA repair protein RadC [Candidatus Edwardsbacteria bacterium]MBU2593024.1 DNA repair protein RadC [Candidatus Edwardsbacteria bacterium]
MDNKELKAGHRQRLKEKFRKAGGDGLHDYELLELLLTYALPRRDVKPLAKELITRFGGLSGVLDASPEELDKVKRLSQGSGILIKLNKAIIEYYMTNEMASRDVLSSPQTVLNFAKAKLAGLPNEVFLCIYLNTKNEVLKHNIINQGTVDKAAVYPRRIIKEALDCHAAGLILVHNHPSGHCQPSPEDKALTDSIISVAKTMDIRVLDHLIVGRLGHFSFAEKNLI